MRRWLTMVLLAGCPTPWEGEGPPDPPDPTGAVTPELPAAAVARLTRAQWRASVSDLLGVDVATTLPDDYALHGHTSVGAGVIATSPLDLERYEAAAWAAADAALAAPADREARMGCRVDPGPTGALSDADALACARAWAADLAGRAWRRPVEVDELASLVAVAEGAIADRGLAVRAVTAAVLLSPAFLYRVETGEPDGATWRYTDHEVAARLALLLTDRGPDAPLRAAADAGALSTPAEVRAQAARLLDLPAARDAVARFWGEVFQVDLLTTTAKDPELFPELDDALRASMAREIELLMVDVTLDRDVDVREAFTTTATFVDPPLARLYGLGDVAGLVSAEVDPTRGGVLGRAALATAFSHPTQTSPTRRGKLIRTRLLCQSVDPPPPGVSASLDELPEGGTLRERLSQHASSPGCRTCHDRIDPPGFGMEQLDPIGRLRRVDAFQPIDASGDLDGIPFTDLASLGAAVAQHPDLPGCLTLDLWRHVTGQAEGPAQLPLVDAQTDGFVAGGLRWRELLLDLLASDGLLRLRPGEVAAPAETCDGADDDGDGEVDEVARACSADARPGVQACAAGVWGACAPVPAATGPAEVCNQADDDGDGAVDEGLSAWLLTVTDDGLRLAHDACDMGADPMSGACQAAVHRVCAATGCAVTGWGPVQRGDGSSVAACVDRSRATMVQTTFTELAAFHDGCAWTDGHSPSCNAAIHRYCASLGLTTGFGPVEHSGDTAYVACTPGAAVIEATYTEAATYDPACDGHADRWLAPCRAAFHGLCAARGALTGFGPLENSGDVAWVACITAETP